jgi:glycosyltransferase involved in cell wall biosynthesis
MKKFTILIPIFNDWESLEKLLNEINDNIKNIKGAQFDCVVVNDCSTIKNPKIKIPPKINSIRIIHMSKNKGHARCNAFGIKYLSENINFDHLILMDGDGEDRPEEIELLVKKALSDVNTSVVAKRIKRSEGIFFQFLYQLHKVITLMFTGKNINFGNYSCLTKNDVNILSTKASLWSSFSGSL